MSGWELAPAIGLTVAIAFTVAGLVKGLIGLGLPTVAIALLATAMPPGRAAALLVVPALATNLWQLFSGDNLGRLLRRIWPLLLGTCLGIWLTPGVLTGDGSNRAAGFLGAALVAYAIFGLAAPRFSVPPRAEPWLAPLVGLATGAVASATGVFVLPAVPYLGALGLERDDLVTALGLFFTVSTVALAAVLAGAGLTGLAVSPLAVLALVAALAGMWLGTLLRGRISARAFRTVFFVGLLGLGLHLAARAFW